MTNTSASGDLIERMRSMANAMPQWPGNYSHESRILHGWIEEVVALRTALASAEARNDEPVAWRTKLAHGWAFDTEEPAPAFKAEPLYAAPPDLQAKMAEAERDLDRLEQARRVLDKYADLEAKLATATKALEDICNQNQAGPMVHIAREARRSLNDGAKS